MKKTSIQDIADRLGVSKAVISFVLNGKGKEKRISDQMIKKVLKTAEELNYHPNQISKWFRTGKTQTIGLVIADISNPFFGKLGREIEKEAYREGYKIIFCSSDENPVISGRQLEMLKKSMVDGFIIAPPPGSNKQIEALAKANIPYVLIDRYFPEIDSNYVVIDNFTASYNATKHLLDRGRQNIAFLTVNDELTTMHKRTQGYIQAIKEGGSLKPVIFKLPFSHEKKEVFEAIRQLTSAENHTDAILFSSSKIGLMGLEIINDLKINIPNDIAVVSFDDPDYYKICFSPVTAIAQPLEKIGKKAIEILIQEIELGKMDRVPQKIEYDTNFIVRKSSG